MKALLNLGFVEWKSQEINDALKMMQRRLNQAFVLEDHEVLGPATPTKPASNVFASSSEPLPVGHKLLDEFNATTRKLSLPLPMVIQ